MKELAVTTVVQLFGPRCKSPRIDIAGKKYGKLTITTPIGRNQWSAWVWNAICDCGTICRVDAKTLARGLKRSCGCLRGSPTHGMSRNPKTRSEYRILEKMIRRCADPTYKDYHGRGIVVCEEWNHPSKFAAFYAHVGPRPSPMHTIERINNNGNYEPGNVRWATRAEQMRNTRRTVFLTFRGETLCRKDMANKYGIPDWTVKKRLKNGWPLEKALTLPIDPKYVHAA